jgi:hypothetical protein
MRTQFFGGIRRGRDRSGWFALFGLAGLLGIMVVATTRSGSSPAQDTDTGLSTGQSTRKVPRTRGIWYLESGQWQADARTLAATIRYLLEPETPQAAPVPLPTPMEVAMPTNSEAMGPSA